MLSPVKFAFSCGARSLVRFSALLMLFAAVLAVPGCGNSGVTGTYVAEPGGGGNGKITLVLKSGGVAVVTLSGPGGQSMPPVNGTYTVEGDKVIAMLDNHRDVYTMKNGTLTANFMGENLVWKKQ